MVFYLFGWCLNSCSVFWNIFWEVNFSSPSIILSEIVPNFLKLTKKIIINTANNIFTVSRLVHSGRQTNVNSAGEVLSFGTRSGTRNGIETHIFRVETQRDLAHWSRALVQGSHGAASLVKEVTCRKYYYDGLWEIMILSFLSIQ